MVFPPPDGRRSDHCGDPEKEPMIRRVADWVAVLSLGTVLVVLALALAATYITYVVDTFR